MNPYYTPYDYFDMPIFDSTFDFNKCTLTTDLYVEEIDKKVGKKGIIDLFSKYGSLHDMTINLSHPYSKCTAVVKYIYRKDAEQALKQAQYEKLGRYNIVVSFLTDSNGGLVPFKLIVDNIDPTIGLKELHNHFVQGGANILHVKIDTDGQGNSLGTGYVFFETREYFNYALCRLQGSKLKGKELRLSPLLEGIPEIENSDKKFLYVKHLPADKNQDELRKFVKDTFSKYGEIRTVSVAKHPKEDKYSAILQFSDHLHAQEALKDLSTNFKDYGAPEGPLFVAWLQNRTERAQQVKAQHHKPPVESENRVYMKNLRENVTEEDLKYVFKRFGTILNVTCHESLTSDLRKKSCYGVIAYSKAEEACRAVSEALEYSDIRNLYQYHAKPYINLYQSKEEREKCVSIKKLCNAQMNYMGLMNKMWEANKTAFCSAMKQEKPLPVGIYSPFFNLNGENDPSVANREQKNVAKDDQLPTKNNENKQTKTMHDVNKDEIVTVIVKRSPLEEKHIQFVTLKDIKANISAFTQLEIQDQKEIIKDLLLPLAKEIIGEIHASWVLEVITGSENFDAEEVLEWAQEKSSLTRKVSEIMKTLRKNKEKNNQADQGVYCGINVNRLMDYDVDRQKQIVGTLLFPLVRRISGDENAPRVTGMLINESVFEVNSMLSLSKDKVLLEKRVSEAVERIEEEKLLKETSVY